ncbi:MAG: preprotein translocase subunit SecE [Acidimicrobiales bacterium]
MNRETKRLLQRQGQMGSDGTPAVDARKRQQAQAAALRRAPRERTSPATFLREVRAELRRVAWPTRAEVARYSTIVLLTLIVLVAVIFLFDLAFSKSILFLFDA